MGSEPSFSQHLPKEFTNHSKEVVMNKKKLVTAILSGVFVFGSSITAANAEPRVVLEAEPCVLTLPDKVYRYNEELDTYATGPLNSNKVFLTTFITSDMLACPTGVVPSNWSSVFYGNDGYSNQPFTFVSSSNQSGFASFERVNPYFYNPGTPQNFYQESRWAINGESGTYDSIIPQSEGGAKAYLPINGLNYELKLAKPFEFINGNYQSTDACVITLPNLTNYYSDPTGELNTTYLSKSNIKCPEATNGHRLSFSSGYSENDTMGGPTNIAFSDAQGNQLWVELCSVDASNSEAKITAVTTVPCVRSWRTGVFIMTSAGSKIIDSITGIRYPVVLAAPFQIKRATDVAAKVKRSGSYLTITIKADRNYAVDNNRGSTNRRQTVIVNDKADRAVIKRGNKVIATVKLSMYGNGKVKIKDIAGKNNYTVTLIETDGNFAGVASFKK